MSKSKDAQLIKLREENRKLKELVFVLDQGPNIFNFKLEQMELLRKVRKVRDEVRE